MNEPAIPRTILYQIEYKDRNFATCMKGLRYYENDHKPSATIQTVINLYVPTDLKEACILQCKLERLL